MNDLLKTITDVIYGKNKTINEDKDDYPEDDPYFSDSDPSSVAYDRKISDELTYGSSNEKATGDFSVENIGSLVQYFDSADPDYGDFGPINAQIVGIDNDTGKIIIHPVKETENGYVIDPDAHSFPANPDKLQPISLSPSLTPNDTISLDALPRKEAEQIVDNTIIKPDDALAIKQDQDEEKIAKTPAELKLHEDINMNDDLGTLAMSVYNNRQEQQTLNNDKHIQTIDEEDCSQCKTCDENPAPKETKRKRTFCNRCNTKSKNNINDKINESLKYGFSL